MGGDAIGDYLGHLAVERRMSPNTLDGYRRDLAALQAWAEARSQALAGLGGDWPKPCELKLNEAELKLSALRLSGWYRKKLSIAPRDILKNWRTSVKTRFLRID